MRYKTQLKSSCDEQNEGRPAEAVPSTTGCVLLTLRSQMPSRCPTYSLTSWHVALDVVALKLDTICQQKNGRHKQILTGFPHTLLLQKSFLPP